jgi:hydroxyethylthiazole kinase-like uncharacterized protein yjeF
MTINSEYRSWLRKLIDTPKRLVIDADALKILDIDDLPHDASHIIITPHLGEYAAFFKRNMNDVKDEIPNGVFVNIHSKKLNCLLKGKNTLITNGENHYLNPTGNHGMATAGSGDVLSGIIGGLVGQGIDNMLIAGAVGAYIHGMAGDLSAKDLSPYSLVASDIINYLPKVINEYIIYED